MEIKEARRVFAASVRELFASHLAPLGFRLKKVKDYHFTARSAESRVKIVLDLASVHLEVAPTGAPETDEEGITWILAALAPELKFKYRLFRFPSEIPDELRRVMDLLVQFCRPLLQGDPEEWRKVREYLDALRNRPPSEEPPLTTAERIERCRQEGAAAYEREDYWDVYTYYSVILDEGEQLTEEERKRFEEAREWLNA